MPGLHVIASPEQGTASFLSFLHLGLQAGERMDIATGAHEHVLDVLSGACRVSVQSAAGEHVEFPRVGGRADIFSSKPDFIYVPRGFTYSVCALQDPVEAGIYAAPTERTGVPSYIAQDNVKTIVSGVSDWKRDVYIGIGGEGPATAMMVGETHSPPGNWSGFPPHRHAQDQPPLEAKMEEMYFFKFKPASGFAIGGTYQDTNDREGTAKLLFVRDSQIFDVPAGYHFIAPCPGYRLSYIWALGGPSPRFGAWVADPDYAWLANYKE